MAVWETDTLGAVAEMATDKISVTKLSVENYISTDNMLPDRGGVKLASKIPTAGNVNAFLPGDILFSNIRTYFKKVWLARRHGGASADVIIFRPRDRRRVYSSYLYYVLSSDAFIESTVTASKGTKMPRGDRHAMQRYVMPLPPLLIQQRIAGILSAYDELIENSQRRIRILETMARALYHQWFVECRFPGGRDEDIVELETGRVPARWEFGRLEGFLDVLGTGKRPKGGVGSITEGVPSIGAESIIGIGQFDFSKTKYVPRGYFESMRSGIVQDRDVLVYKDGGRPGIFIPHVTLFGSGFPFEEMAINSHVYRLRARQGISQEYLYFYLSSEAVLHWMHMHGSGAAIPSLARNDLKQLPFVRPDTETLETFDKFAQPLVAQILVLARQIRNLRVTRDLLLPRLLSGQLDLEAA